MVTFRDSRPILSRGPAPGLRFFFFAVLSFTLMWLDQRQHYLEQIRHVLSMATYPIQVVVSSPAAGWNWLKESFTTRDTLREENAALSVQLRAANLRLMRFEALEQENLRLREMRAATTGIADQVVVAEIMRVDINPFRHRVIINKGTRDGVFSGQPLLDAKGVFGQVTRAGAYSSEVILISDTEHAIPVQVNRNGLRTIAVGTGETARLSLPFLPTNADIEEGDLLVSSGLGGIFPPGYPVGTVSQVKTETAQLMAEISAKPAAALDRDREVLLVWVKEPPHEDLSKVPTQITPLGKPPTTPPARPEAKSGTKSQPKPGVEVESKAKAETDAKPSAPAEKPPAAKPQAKPETKPQARP